jgi:para-nitrobenzyl esterase
VQDLGFRVTTLLARRVCYRFAQEKSKMQIRSKAILTFAIAALMLVTSEQSFANPLTVKTGQGKAHGKAINEGKVRAFLGLPYAAPPVGALRWKAPEPATKWKGERDATKYGSRCVQRAVFADMIFQDATPSEDCLYLNVFTPAGAKDKSKLPVMFWIHGGGYAGGSASEPRHNGDFLPTKGVVLVTINYRLGIFGFLATSELAKEANGSAGNYGLMDMIAALNWVKANIAKFGGDPANVTIFGESAGSSAVSTLMASPMARGLFHKVIGESGAAFGGTLATNRLEERTKRDDQWVNSLGVSSLADLRAMPADKILEAVGKPGTPGFSVVVDGRVLTEPVPETFAKGQQAHVPLIAGWNRDEGGAIKDLTVDKWKTWAADHFQNRAAEFLRLYPGDTDERASRSSADLAGDTFIAFSTWKWVIAHRKTGDSPIYRYHLELPAPPSKFHPGSVAFHSDDIEYVFGTLDTRPGAEWRPEDRTLSEQMMTYWTNFAKTGDPNSAGVPLWPKLGTENIVLHFDNPITVGPSQVEPRYEFLLQGVPSTRP